MGPRVVEKLGRMGRLWACFKGRAHSILTGNVGDRKKIRSR